MTTTSLHTVPLGRTDMTITRVGFGAWAVGGPWAVGWGPQDDRESIAAIRHAVEHGVNWIDTAPAYGAGHSEEIIGRALADLPESDRPYVFTKCGLVFLEGNPNRPPQRVLTAESIRAEVEASLRRLRTERLDLLQVHWPAPDGPPLEEYWRTLAALREEGKVRAIGLSNHGRRRVEAAEAVAHVDTLQPHFSAIARQAASELLPWCSEHHTGVIVYSPMESGLLTGKYDAAGVAALPDDDWRRRHPAFTTELEANRKVAAALSGVAQRHEVSTAAAAVAWTLAWSGVTGAIVGARSAAQVDGWVPAAGLVLTDTDLDEVATAIADGGAGDGPGRP
jgi:aryl-alcohol dehydrogenase-like predicted oxidoreductase